MTVGCLLIAGATNSTPSSDPILSTYHVTNIQDESMMQIADQFEVVRKLKNGYEVLVPVDQAQNLLKLAPFAKLIEVDNSAALRKLTMRAQRSSLTNTLRQYQLHDQIIKKLQTLASNKPELVQFVEYGKSADGRTLFAVKISDNVETDEDEPELMITAATHGDEIITTEVALGLIDKLIAGYGSDQRLTNMINSHELYFIPVVNADGFVARARYDKGVDPNRSYPSPENPNAKSTASISALIDFFNSRNFVGTLDFHAYGELTMYPWAFTYDSVPQKDKDIFNALTKKMSATNGYTFGPISKVIYIAKGSSADYYYWAKNTISVAIEMGNSKAPYPNEIESYIKEQTESTWVFIENF